MMTTGAPTVNALVFRLRWGTLPGLPRVYDDPGCVVHSRIVPWTPDWLESVHRGLEGMPRRLVNAARVHSLFVADGLMNEGDPADAVTYCTSARKLIRYGIPATWMDRAIRKRLLWVGLNRSLFDDPTSEPYLRVPMLDSRLAEEFAHAWDYRLECRRSPFSSAGSLWGRHFAPIPINVPNRKDYSHLSDSVSKQRAEDWASAVIWFIYRPEYLRRKSRPHHDFARALLSVHRIKT
jgi:hypothetical protein